MNDQIESTFQLPPELQDVPTNYSMTHITFEDVQGILSLVDIALARGSIKGDELAILNQIRTDCIAELTDFQSWQQKRQQIMAVEQQIENEKKKADALKEIEGIKATADAKVQAAQDASRILQNRVNELENQAKARGITPVVSEHSDEELNVAMKPTNMGKVSKAFENARAQNPVFASEHVPVITNQPKSPSQEMQDDLEPIFEPEQESPFGYSPQSEQTFSINPELNEKVQETKEAFEEYERTHSGGEWQVGDNISDEMQKAWDRIEAEENANPIETPTEDGGPGSVEPMFKINIGQDGNVPLGDKVTEEDINMNVTEMDDFEPIQGDGEVEIELQEDPESVADVQAMKEAVEEEYEEVVIPNSMELQKMTKAKIKEVADSIGITVSDNQTKSAMIKDFEEESWNLIKEAEENENATVHTDEDIIRDGGYFGDDNDSK